MSESITFSAIKKMVRNLLLPGLDYRQEVVQILDAQFLDFAIAFFKKVAMAKADNKVISLDWYKENFVSADLPKEQIALNAGLNMKTINNIHATGRREIVIDAAGNHYDGLKALINTLTESDNDIDFTLAIKINKVSVELTMRESLIVINGIAVHRAAMRGGLWSSAGKRCEKLLMITLCKLYSVEQQYWSVKQKREDGHDTYTREIDFFMIDNHKKRYKCEVKLMGKGNPEGADAVIARHSNIFVADTLSQTNKKQLESNKIHWVALNEPDGYKRFKLILESLNIPHKDFNGNIERRVDKILSAEVPHDSMGT